ncbi:MAG TPA: hypothetical protein VE258_07100 [Ktedonobacterales bacterium]|nr:hypothetical protein [Ktedonobacterales bacterium]
MTTANKTSAWVYRLDLSIAALASQGLPFQGFLLPVVKGLTGM